MHTVWFILCERSLIGKLIHTESRWKKDGGVDGRGWEITTGCGFLREALVAQIVKNLPAMRETHPGLIPGSGSSFGEATHSSILAWRIPWTEETGRLRSVQFSRSVMSNSLLPHGLQHARPPCPSPTPGVYSNSRSSSWWCHPTITSSVIPFSSFLQSFPASGSFPVSQLFASGTLEFEFQLQHQSFQASLVAQRVKCLPAMQETCVRSPEKEMATYSSILAWRIPWTKEPGRLQFMGSQRVRHDWATSLSLSVLPRNIQDWFPLGWTGCYLLAAQFRGHQKSDTTEWLTHITHTRGFSLRDDGNVLKLAVIMFAHVCGYTENHWITALDMREPVWSADDNKAVKNIHDHGCASLSSFPALLLTRLGFNLEITWRM